jgi:hypothetical protein
LGGELWHPRTTVAEITPLEERSTELKIEGVSRMLPIDKLGILVKEGDTQNHFKEVLDMLKKVETLKINS